MALELDIREALSNAERLVKVVTCIKDQTVFTEPNYLTLGDLQRLNGLLTEIVETFPQTNTCGCGEPIINQNDICRNCYIAEVF